MKNLVVYFDHEDLYNSVSWDDVVANPMSELPKVISPCKVHYAEKNPKKSCLFSTQIWRTLEWIKLLTIRQRVALKMM